VHLERFVQLVDRLASVKPEDIAKDSMKRTLIGTQLRGLPKQFGQLLDLMQEHAQMEERIIFPALEMADPGIECKDLVKFA
jgi:iron-sulfur cluster repair protein YtfE (RIC family)